MKLTNEFIRGLVVGEGCFTFHTTGTKVIGKEITRWKMPAFVLSMHVRDRDLINAVADRLGVEDMVYWHKSSNKDGVKRGDKATLAVRKISSLKDIIVPFFYKKLSGYKADQFEEWIENIGNDPNVRESYKIIYRLYKSGYWDKKENYIFKEFWE